MCCDCEICVECIYYDWGDWCVRDVCAPARGHCADCVHESCSVCECPQCCECPGCPSCTGREIGERIADSCRALGACLTNGFSCLETLAKIPHIIFNLALLAALVAAAWYFLTGHTLATASWVKRGWTFGLSLARSG